MQKLLARPDHHAEEGDLLERWAEALDFFAKLSAVKGLRNDGSATGHAARRVRMIVGKDRAKIKLKGRLGLEELHSLGAGVQKAVYAIGVEMVAGLMLKVSARLFDAVLHPCPLGRTIVRHPHPATRSCSRTAKNWLLFDHQHFQTAMRRSNRRRQAASS